MLPLFKAGLGGRLGSGKQPFSFIHIKDLCRAVDHLIVNQNSAGVYNLVGQYPATNQVLTDLLARQLNRPAFFPVPELALRVVYGEAATMLTRGATVLPARLLEEGFIFEFSDLNRALADLIVKQ